MSEASELRPRYRFTCNLPEAEIHQRLKDAMRDPEKNTEGLQQRSVSGHMLISFRASRRHFWSPVMDINLEPASGNRSLVRVLMGPEPSIWTMFMFFYTIGGLAVLAGMVLGYSQYILGHELYWLLLIPGGLLWISFFYVAALMGKSRARRQMKILKGFLEEAIGQPVFHEEGAGNASVA